MEAFSVELSEAGALTLSLAAFLKDMNGVGKTGAVNPGHLFGQVRERGVVQLLSLTGIPSHAN